MFLTLYQKGSVQGKYNFKQVNAIIKMFSFSNYHYHREKRKRISPSLIYKIKNVKALHYSHDTPVYLLLCWHNDSPASAEYDRHTMGASARLEKKLFECCSCQCDSPGGKAKTGVGILHKRNTGDMWEKQGGINIYHVVAPLQTT